MPTAMAESGAEQRGMMGQMCGWLSSRKVQERQSDSGASARGRHGLSMRFSPPVEAAFLASRHRMLCLNTSYMAMLAMFPTAMYLTENVLVWSEDIFIFKVRCVTVGALMCFLSLCAVLPRLQCVQTRVSFAAMEAIVVVAMAWFILSLVFAPAVMRGVFGLPAEALGAMEESKQAVVIVSLGLDALLTCSHLALPVRWFIMVWVDLLFVVLYSLYAYMTFSAISEELGYQDFYAIVVFAVLAAGASFGLRTVESRDRLLFTTIADERTLRAQAEFNAHSQVQDIGKETGAHSKSSNWSSDAASLFRNAAEQNEGSLAKIVDLGIQEQWLIAEHELNVLEDTVLGKGGFGTVVAGEFCSSAVAVKCYRRGRSMTVFDELRIMRRLRHPNIVLFYGACIDTGSSDLKLVLELVLGISLDRFTVQVEAWRSESPNREKQLSVMEGICQAFIYLHSRKPCIVHSDLKPANIMVEQLNSWPLPKLLDFGLSRRVTRRSRQEGGTYRYMAPELVLEDQERPSPAADVYSLGLVLFSVSSGLKPFGKLEGKQILRLIRDMQEAPRLDWQPSTALLRMLKPLIQKCTALAPARRPTVQQVHDELYGTSTRVAHGQELLEDRASAACSSTAAAPPIIEEALGRRDLGNKAPCYASL